MKGKFIIAAIVFTPAVLLQECSPYTVSLLAANKSTPSVLATRWYAYSVTVWSDGTTEINPTTELTPERAEAVADKVGADLAVEKAKLTHQVEQLRVEVRRLTTQIEVQQAKLPAAADAKLPPAAAASLDDGRCKEWAKAGVRCKRVSCRGTGYCEMHLALRFNKLTEVEKQALTERKPN